MPTETRPLCDIDVARPHLLPRPAPGLRPPAGHPPDLVGREAGAVGPDHARGHHLRVDPRRPVLLRRGGAADPVDRPVDHRTRRRAAHPSAAPAEPGLLPPDDPGHGGPGPPGRHRGARSDRRPGGVRLRDRRRRADPAGRHRRAHGTAHRGPGEARRLVRPDDGRRGPAPTPTTRWRRRRGGLQRIRHLRDHHGRGPACSPARGPRDPRRRDQDPGRRGRGRRPRVERRADPRRAHHVPGGAAGGGQRNDAQRHRRGDGRLPAVPRPVGAAAAEPGLSPPWPTRSPVT